jgi:hypothetical protein
VDDDADLRLAALAYVTLVMRDLQAHGVSVPRIELRGGGWRAEGRGDLFRYSLMPDEPALQFIDALGRHSQSDEHLAFVDSLRRHAVIKDRIDTQIGTAFSSSQVDAETIPEQLMWGMPPGADRLTTGSFDAAFNELCRFLIRDHEEYLVIAPLVNVELEDRIGLREGLELDHMTDDEVAACLATHVLTPFGSPGSAWVHSRQALRIRDSVPIKVGDEFEIEMGLPDDAYRRWGAEIEDALHLMRLFKDGQVWARGAACFARNIGAYAQAYITLPLAHSTANASTGAYQLSATDSPSLCALWDAAHSPRTLRSKPLQTALRRFGFAGERIRAEDQLIDLVIAAEAVFLTDEQQESANKLALRSALFLRGVAGTPTEIFRTMKRAYLARSKVAHGGAVPELKFANGDPATVEDYVRLVAGYMRYTLTTLLQAAKDGEELPMRKWDELLLAALEPPGPAGD